MLKINMLRHLATAGNLQKRYIGITDEPLCKEGLSVLEGISYPPAEAVYVSPMRRCKETARLIYPDIIPIACEDFRECNFGEFENKNYMELSNNSEYQAWIDSNGTLPFPKGENPVDFRIRCVKEFERVVASSLKSGYRSIVLIVHGGTIMSILERFSYPREDYFHWRTENGKGYITCLEEEEGRLTNICRIQ
jgi:alpha-ribazole phosphatase